MREKFHEFYGSLKKDRENSEWSKQHSLETRYEELCKEVKEFGEAIKSGNKADIKDELGDVLWDLIACSIIAEEAGILTLKQVLEHANKKLKKRKPWVFEGRSITLEEEKKEYKERKEGEKR